MNSAKFLVPLTQAAALIWPMVLLRSRIKWWQWSLWVVLALALMWLWRTR